MNHFFYKIKNKKIIKNLALYKGIFCFVHKAKFGVMTSRSWGSQLALFQSQKLSIFIKIKI